MIRAVTIDFWNTLVDSSNGEARRSHRHAAMAEALEHARKPWNDAEIERAFSRSYEEFERRWFGEHRTMTASESLEIIWSELAIAIPEEMHRHVVEAFEESILIGPPALLQGCADAVRALASRYRLAVVSDTAFSPGSMLRRVLEMHGIASVFEIFVFSDENGVAKPHPASFGKALAALGVDAREAVHIGDIERTDIDGAKGIGMRAILFHGDRARPMYDPVSATRADAVAASWDEIPGILDRWGRTADPAPNRAHGEAPEDGDRG